MKPVNLSVSPFVVSILDLSPVSHNSANFQARASKFDKVVNLEEEKRMTGTTTMTTRTTRATTTIRVSQQTEKLTN